METVENLVKTTLGEIEKVLSTKTVVGEALTIEGATLIPLISAGFGFGAGGGSGKGEAKQKGEGTGGGTLKGCSVGKMTKSKSCQACSRAKPPEHQSAC